MTTEKPPRPNSQEGAPQEPTKPPAAQEKQSPALNTAETAAPIAPLPTMPGNTAAGGEDTSPLLREDRREVASEAQGSRHPGAITRATVSPKTQTQVQRARLLCQRFLTSKVAHYSILLLVALDVSCIFGDIFISLIRCEKEEADSRGWSIAQEALGWTSLAFSCLFMVELIVAVTAFGRSYFNSWFHYFDAAVIIIGFVVDVLLHGVIEEVASLIVILRLWRIFKIVEEFSVGAQEQMDALNEKVERLQRQNTELEKEVETLRKKTGEHQNGKGNGANREEL